MPSCRILNLDILGLGAAVATAVAPPISLPAAPPNPARSDGGGGVAELETAARDSWAGPLNAEDSGCEGCATGTRS